MIWRRKKKDQAPSEQSSAETPDEQPSWPLPAFQNDASVKSNDEAFDSSPSWLDEPKVSEPPVLEAAPETIAEPVDEPAGTAGKRFQSDDEPATAVAVTEPEPQVAAPEPAPAPKSDIDPDAKTVLWPWFLTAGALACWIYALVVTDTSDLTRLGLVGVFPIAYFVGLALVTASFVGGLVSKRPSHWLLGANTLLLIAMIHATTAVLFSEPRYNWSYKHFGVTEHIMETGAVDPRVDIYQNMPGMFALFAWFGEVSGLGDPVNYAKWAQFFNNTLIFAMLAFLYRTLTDNVRVMWLSIFVFFAASWVAQDYYAPQAFVFILTLTVYGMIARWVIDPDPKGKLYRLVTKLLHPRKKAHCDEGLPPARVLRTPGTSATWAIAGIAFIFFVISASHQLTPYLVLAGVGALMVMSQLKEKALFFLLGAVAVVYLIPHLPFVQDQYGLLSDLNPLSNAKNASVEKVSASAQMEFVSQCARLLSVFVWALAIIGFFKGLWRGKRDLIAAILMVAPFVVIAGQSYGGEAIYRVYLFSLPFAALLAARFLMTHVDRAFLWRFAKPFVVLSVCLTMMMPAYFGLESINEIPSGEVEASRHFYETAPHGSLLLTVVASFPMRSKGSYDQYQLPSGGDIAPSLSTYPDFEEQSDTTPKLFALLEGTMNATPGIEKYVVLSTGQQRATDLLAIGSPTMIPDLEAVVSTSPDWKLAYSNEDARLYRYVKGTPEAPADTTVQDATQARG